jgi:hypothetical protein
MTKNKCSLSEIRTDEPDQERVLVASLTSVLCKQRGVITLVNHDHNKEQSYSQAPSLHALQYMTSFAPRNIKLLHLKSDP